MAEVAFLVRGLCGPKEASLLVPKAQREPGHPTQQGLGFEFCLMSKAFSWCRALFFILLLRKQIPLGAHDCITVAQRN